MNNKNATLSAVWHRLSDYITKKDTDVMGLSADEIIASIICPGPCHYFVLNYYDMQIMHLSPNIYNVLGLHPEPTKLEDIVSRVHPDDIDFVAKAEESALKYIYENMGKHNLLKYEMSYCFRLKIADGTYQLFQHQAIILSVDENGSFGKSLII